jgi:hypothetical protein
VLQTTTFSCVLDNDALRTLLCYLWVNCLIELRAVTLESIFVHHAGIGNVDIMRWLRSRHVNLIDIAADDGHGPSRKRLGQLKTFSGRPFGRLVLMDCGTAWVGDAPLPDDGPIAAKRASVARIGSTPPFRNGPAPSRPTATTATPCFVSSRASLFRFSSPRGANGPIGASRRPSLLALALRDLDVSVALLPAERSYPIHAPSTPLPDIELQILRYEPRFGPNLRLAVICVAKPDAAIDALNQWMTEFFTKSVRPQRGVGRALSRGAGTR